MEFFKCSPAFLPPGTEHIRGDQIGRVAAKLGVDYAPALTGFETKQGRQVPVLDGIIVCKEQIQARNLLFHRKPAILWASRSFGVPHTLRLRFQLHDVSQISSASNKHHKNVYTDMQG